MKGRLLLTSALFVFVHIPPQAQVTVDVSKITCEQYLGDEITFSQNVVMWLSGYYNGKRNNTISGVLAVKQEAERRAAAVGNMYRLRALRLSRANRQVAKTEK